MIVTEIYNGQGLGNQLWCYVTTRVIAKDKGYTFGIKSPQKFKCNDFLDLDFGEEVIGGSGPEGGPPQLLPEGITHYYHERKIVHPENGVDIRMYDKNLVSVPDNTKIDGIMQDEQYIVHRKDEIRQWLKVRAEFECYDYAADDMCVINFRGGEYVHAKDIFLPQSYWDNAVAQMQHINSKMKFVVITDDVKTARRFFPSFPVHHFSIAKDYVVIKNAHYLILSNSSFACFPAWLNEKLKCCIAPKYWSQFNASDGFWGCSYNMIKGWKYMDRSGVLSTYAECKKEFEAYVKEHAEYFTNPKIKNAFLVVSDYKNDIQWVPEYTNDYLIYDKNEESVYPPTIDQSKVVKSPNVGYNLRDYFTYIIDHYTDLPERVFFVKGNTVPRHVSKTFFDSILNNKVFTPVEDPKEHAPKWPTSFFSSDGGFCEINTSWYLHHFETRYFNSYNDFLTFCFKNPVIPRYIRFAPGANYLVAREQILRFPKAFYENLRLMISYTQLAGEAHIVERAMHTIWTAPFALNEKMTVPLAPEFRAVTKQKTKKAQVIAAVKKVLSGSRAKKEAEVSSYRKGIKIYDIFTFFDELDLLEMRLHILAPYVDKFVIVECAETFSGLPKSLVYQENKERFAQYHDKIIHYVVENVPQSEKELRSRLSQKHLSELDREIITSALTSDNVPEGALHWLKEFYQKESLKKPLVGLNDNDICFVSDVDEIWNPEVLIDYRSDNVFKLRQLVYAYYLNNRSSEPWAGTLVTKYKNIKNGCLNHLRTVRKTKYTYVKNGGWHFTNQGGAEKIRKKLESYGHQEYNNDEIKSQIEEKINSNTDFVGRKFRFWLDEKNLPWYLLQNREKYKHLFKNR